MNTHPKLPDLFNAKPDNAPPPPSSPQPPSSLKPPPSALATPMMTQYLNIKRQHQNRLLFYRMGDFYELFFDDAEKAAPILNIALTQRGKHLGHAIPMCGVPVHAADHYLAKLIRAGHQVAICEQDPNQKPKSGQLIKRQVVRIITQGTITEDNLLDANAHNYLLAFCGQAIAWADISTGEFFTRKLLPAHTNKNFPYKNLLDEINRIQPQEIIHQEKNSNTISRLKEQSPSLTITELPAPAFHPKSATKRLNQAFGQATAQYLEQYHPDSLRAAGALLDYIQITQVYTQETSPENREENKQGKMQPPIIEGDHEFMIIDAAARASLEITHSLYGDQKQTTLLGAMDQTLTGAGSRLLAARLRAPLTKTATITKRQDEIAWFLNHQDIQAEIRNQLKQTPDMLRALSRLSFNHIQPRDLTTIRDGLRAVKNISDQLDQAPHPPDHIQHAHHALSQPDRALVESLFAALADDMPATLRDGGVIRPNYDSALDRQRNTAKENRRQIITLQQKYIRQTKIKNLKVKHNNIIGYHIETPAATGTSLLEPPLAKTFIHKQTLANVLRFSTRELADYASAELEASAAALSREKTIIEKLIHQLLQHYDAITQAAHALASLDVATSLSTLAERYHYCRPQIDDSQHFQITQGRHPIIEIAQKKYQQIFIPNDCHLNPNKNHLWLLTGPNMAGKSTFLRQNALITIMAQMGSFVPAQNAHIGIVDRLFSRVGAADNLTAGQSTFMLEMVETATILTQATKKSFVIIDEIGRGTATFDGLAIAWAVIEYLHQKIACRAICATHFHELTELQNQLQHLENHHMKTKRNDTPQNSTQTNSGEIRFLHEVGPGPASQSFGVHVARHAGLPHPVIQRAAQLLAQLEQQKQSPTTPNKNNNQHTHPPPPKNNHPKNNDNDKNKTETIIAKTDLNNLSPRQAHQLLYELKEKINKETNHD